MAILECRDIEKVFNNDGVETRVLYGVSLQIEKGEFVSIMGPSGSGKSTLMHILGLLDMPTKGEYFFMGRKTVDFSEDDLARLRNQKIGFVFQSFNLLPRTSVFENVELPLLYNLYDHTSDDEDRKISFFNRMKIRLLSPTHHNHTREVEEALRAVGMEHRMRYRSNQLSGGEKQRVAIARSLVNNPEIIFADEPTGNLDSKSGLQVMRILQELNEQGRTIILVTHETYTAEHAKRIIRLKDGKIISDESLAQWRIAKEERQLK